jgi:putative transposase
MRKTFLYRLYPTKEQQRLFNRHLEECRWLWNYLLAERREAWEQRQETLKLYDQQATLPMLKAERPALAEVQSQVLQNVAVRLDLAFKAFFRRVQAGEEQPGYPRFRGVGRYDSLTFPQVPAGCRLVESSNGDGDRADGTPRIHIHGVGQVKVVLHRPLEGTPKTATIRRHSTGKWYVSFSCECAEPTPLPPTGRQVGLDMGLVVFAMPSEGAPIDNPRFFRTEERALAKAQRRLSQVEQGTPERAARRHVVARVYERMRWRREDFAHQNSRQVVNAYDLIAVERLDITAMVARRTEREGNGGRNESGEGKPSGGGSSKQKKPRLAKSIHDAAWGQFAHLLAYKAAWAGRQYAAIDPAYTSQDCSRCGHRQTLSLSERTYHCPACGLVLDRDRNAARNTLRLGQQSLAAA